MMYLYKEDIDTHAIIRSLMISAERMFEQYKNLTPEQRNTELRNLFKLVPDLADPAATKERLRIRRGEISGDNLGGAVETYKGGMEDAGRRDKSVLRNTVPERLDVLLSLANITRTGRERIINMWGDLFNFGLTGGYIDRHEDPLAEFGKLLGWEPQGDEGLFVSSRACEIEASLYRERLDQRKFIKEIMQQQREQNPELAKAWQEFAKEWRAEEEQYPVSLNEEHGSKMLEDAVKERLFGNSEDSVLERWREEIIVLHGTQP